MPGLAKLAIEDVDAEEREVSVQPFGNIYMIALPMPVYTALSDAAAKKGLTVAQLLSKAFSMALKED
jgi:predicted DNA-binding ribbon-helix-helix protein